MNFTALRALIGAGRRDISFRPSTSIRSILVVSCHVFLFASAMLRATGVAGALICHEDWGPGGGRNARPHGRSSRPNGTTAGMWEGNYSPFTGSGGAL